MNPDKLLTLLMGRCWHKIGEHPYKCSICGQSEADYQGWFICPTNPSFSDPRHRDEFFTWLTREKPEMWEMFLSWAKRQYEHPWAWEGKTIPWLFFSSPSRPRDLMAEWLQLPETVERFGWEECPNCDVFNTGFCTTCGGPGRVLSAWAQYAKEGTI